MSEFKILYSKLDKDEYTQVEKLKIVNQLSQMFEDYNISLSSSIRIKGEIINHKRWTFVDKIFFSLLYLIQKWFIKYYTKIMTTFIWIKN